jgi:diguanylate cyclase
MSDLYKEHVDITYEVKTAIEKMKVVFPADYGKLYQQTAQLHHIELKPEQMLNSEMLDEKMVRHLVTLAKCTDDAINAIESEDKQGLKLILIRTRSLQEEIHELQKIVYEDTLTKSYNRKWFEDTLCNGDRLSIRGSGTMVMVDLNKFKEINDNYGHIVGDKILIRVAEKLKESGGRVVRYGGDEFILIFDSKFKTQEVKTKIEEVLRYFSKIHFKIEEKEFQISFSYGMAPFTSGALVEHVIEAADRAMYQDKSRKPTHDHVIG